MKTTRIKQTLAALFSAVCFSTLASAQITDAVYSVNIIGMQKVASPANLSFRANPFAAMPLGDVAGYGGKTGTSITTADNLLIWDTATQNYKTYYLRSNSTVGIQWRIDSTWATNVYLTPGQGFLYRNRATGELSHVVVGDVVTMGAVTNVIVPGLQLLSYPFSTRVRMSDINLKKGVFGSSITVADNIMMWDPVTQNYKTYYLRSNSTVGIEWRIDSTWATNVYVEPGQSFWFRSRAGSSYQWVEKTPYPNL